MRSQVLQKLYPCLILGATACHSLLWSVRSRPWWKLMSPLPDHSAAGFVEPGAGCDRKDEHFLPGKCQPMPRTRSALHSLHKEGVSGRRSCGASAIITSGLVELTGRRGDWWFRGPPPPETGCLIWRPSSADPRLVFPGSPSEIARRLSRR